MRPGHPGFVLAFVSGVVLAGACRPAPRQDAAAAPPAIKSYTVTIDGTAFQPPLLTVKAGDEVIWVNKDPFPHTATSKTGAFDSGQLAPNASWKFTVPRDDHDEHGERGERKDLDYVCSLHPTMKATLRIE
jgi:plastocyanin